MNTPSPRTTNEALQSRTVRARECECSEVYVDVYVDVCDDCQLLLLLAVVVVRRRRRVIRSGEADKSSSSSFLHQLGLAKTLCCTKSATSQEAMMMGSCTQRDKTK
jgi:hypothetical protein